MQPTISQLQAVVDNLDSPSAGLKTAVYDLLRAVAQHRSSHGQPFQGAELTTYRSLLSEVE